MDEYIIVDDAIPKKFQNEIEDILLGNNGFPWYYVNDITLTKDKIKKTGAFDLTPAFNHVFYDEFNTTNNLIYFVKPIIYMAADKINLDFKRIIQARAFLQIPTTKKIKANHPHIDLEIEHIACIYYVSDNTAPTILYNETIFNTSMSEITEKKFTPLVEILPKKGRCLFFKGKYFHSSTTPKDSTRTVINFDIC